MPKNPKKPKAIRNRLDGSGIGFAITPGAKRLSLELTASRNAFSPGPSTPTFRSGSKVPESSSDVTNYFSAEKLTSISNLARVGLLKMSVFASLVSPGSNLPSPTKLE